MASLNRHGHIVFSLSEFLKPVLQKTWESGVCYPKRAFEHLVLFIVKVS